jgi:hypothetical protein
MEIERFIMSDTELAGFAGAYAREGETDILFDVRVDGRDLFAQVRAYDYAFKLIPLSRSTFIDPGDLEEATIESINGTMVMESGGSKYVRVSE